MSYFKFNYWRTNAFSVLHLTEKSLRVLQLEFINGKFHVRNFRSFFVSGDVKYNNLIRKKIKKEGFLRSQVALVIPDAITLRKSLKVSKKLNQEDLRELARMEANKYLLHNSDDVCFDYFVTNSQDLQNDYCRIIIVAAKSNLILSKMNFLNTLGIDISTVDIESNCILRVVKSLQSNLTLNATTVWFEVSENVIKTFLIKDNDIVFLNEDNYKNTNSFVDIFTKIERVLAYNAITNLDFLYLSGSYFKLEELREVLVLQKNISVIIPELNNLSDVSSKSQYLSHKFTITLGMALNTFETCNDKRF